LHFVPRQSKLVGQRRLPALDCLAEVVDASGDTPVLFDSGIRSGAA